MKEIPMLFSTPMVQSVLAGNKTVTRRTTGLDTFNEKPDDWKFQSLAYHEKLGLQAFFVPVDTGSGWYGAKCPYGKPGDTIWVREAWTWEGETSWKDACRVGGFYYRADNDPFGPHKWKPSIHMPKEAARIWLEVTDIKIQRLHDMHREDVIKEGTPIYHNEGKPLIKLDGNSSIIIPGKEWKDWNTEDYYKYWFGDLWISINGPESWQSNPWVWVVSFEVLSTTGRPSTVTH